MSFIGSDGSANEAITRGTIVIAGMGNDMHPFDTSPDCSAGYYPNAGNPMGTTNGVKKYGPLTRLPGGFISADPNDPTNPLKDYKVICVGATIIGQEHEEYGNDCQLYYGCLPGSTEKQPVQKRGVEQFTAKFNYSPGTDKFNTSTNTKVRTNAKQQATMDLVAPTDILVATEDVTTATMHFRKYQLDAGTSNAIPQVSGVAALMVSVYKHLGVDLDLNNDGIIDNGQEVQRRAHAILTLTTDKLQDFDNIPTTFATYRCCEDQHPTLYSFEKPPFFQYADYSSQDPLQRTWAPRMGFGRLNAYRAVAHAIANKGSYTYSTSATLPFTSNTGQIGNGYVNERGEMLMHFGSWKNSTQAVLEAGGVSLPLAGQYHNNQGVTYVNGSGTVLTVPANSVLAIDGIVTTANIAGHNSIRSASGSNARILATGYLSNVELAGNLRLADLYIYGSSGGIGSAWMGGAGTESHIYSKVTLLNDGMLSVSSGKSILQPSGEVYLYGNKDFIIKDGGVLEMASSSGIYGNYGRRILIQSGSKLIIKEKALATINCIVEVEKGAELVLSTNCTAEIQNIVVQRGGVLTCQPGSNLILLQGMNNAGKFIAQGTAMNKVRISGRREKCDWRIKDTVVDKARITMLSIPDSSDYSGSLASIRHTEFDNVAIGLINTPTDPVEYCTFRANRSFFKEGTMLTKLVRNRQGPASVTGLSIDNCLFVDDAGDINGQSLDDPAWRGDDNYEISGVRVSYAKDLTVTKSEFRYLMNAISSDLVDDILVTENTFYTSNFGVHDGRSAIVFCNNNCEKIENSQTYEASRVGQTYDNTYNNIGKSLHALNTTHQYMRNNIIENYREGIRTDGSPIKLNRYGYVPRPECPTGYAMVENGFNDFLSEDYTHVSAEFLQVQIRDPYDPSQALQRDKEQQWDISLEPTSDISIAEGYNKMGFRSGYHLYNRVPQAINITVSTNDWLDPVSSHTVRHNAYVSTSGSNIDQQDDTDPSCDLRYWCSVFPIVHPEGPYVNTGGWQKYAPATPFLDTLYVAARSMMLTDTTSMIRRIKMHDALQAATLDDSSNVKMQQLTSDYRSIANDTTAPTEVRSRALMMKGEIHERRNEQDSAISVYNEVMTHFTTTRDSIPAAWRVQFINAISSDSTYETVYELAVANWEKRVLLDLRRMSGYADTSGSGPLKRSVHNDWTKDFIPGTDSPLLAVLPNPMSTAAEVLYTIAMNGPTRLTISDIIGREINILIDEVQTTGQYRIHFDAGSIPQGLYLLRLENGGAVTTTKLVIMP